MQSNYLQQSLAVFLPLHKSSFDFPVFEPLLRPVYWWTWQNPTQNLQKPIDPHYNMHGATFWERLRAGNFSLDSGQLLQGIYAFCRKKSCMTCVQNCISKMHVQNCIKGASLEAMEASIESKSCVHLHLSSKKSGTQLYLCDEYGNSLQKNNFLVGHEISFVFIKIITTAEISNEWTLIAEFNDDFAWKEGEIERPTQRHENTEVNSFSRVSPLKGSVYRVS